MAEAININVTISLANFNRQGKSQSHGFIYESFLCFLSSTMVHISMSKHYLTLVSSFYFLNHYFFIVYLWIFLKPLTLVCLLLLSFNVTNGEESILVHDSYSRPLAYRARALANELLRRDILTDIYVKVNPVTFGYNELNNFLWNLL